MRSLFVLTILAMAALACNMGAPTATAQPTRTLQSTTLPPLGGAGFGTADAFATTTLQPTPTSLTACNLRTDWPTITVMAGDTLFGIAQATGATTDDLVAANCLPSADVINAGQTIYVPNRPTYSTGSGNQSGGVYVPPSAGSSSSASCNNGNAWFFAFRAEASETSCPGPLVTTSAVGQNFQGGRVYIYAPTGGEARGTIYVIFNDGSWQSFPDTWDASQPNDDPNIIPLESWYKPYGAIGKLWREQPGMRDRLGWAYQPESAFTGYRQQPVNGGYFYVAHGLRNLALRLYPSGIWQVVGTYS